MKTEDLLALVNSGFLWEKDMDMWRAAAGDPYPMEKNPNEVPMFSKFVERGLALRANDFFKGLLNYYGIEYLNLNPMVFFISLSSCTSVKHLWESSPTGSCSGSFFV
jgi:elongation factor P hydroxylase